VATDQQFESTIERIVATLRGELASAFQKHAAEVAERSAAERDTAMRQATEAVRQETQEQIQQVRRAAQEQVDAARRAAQEQVDAARRTTQAETAARARAEAQVEEVRNIGRSQVEEVQRLMADRLSGMTRELDESRREVAARRHELDSARGASAASLADLGRGVHAVDEAESLTEVLHRLIEAAQQHSKSASVLLVRDEGLREWAGEASDARARISERGMSVASNAALERRRVESESAIAFPVIVGGEVIAVLYAEVDDALSPQRRMSKDALDTLTRHAGRVLETITVQQAAGLRPLRRVSTASRSGHSLGERLS
jgi:glutamine synthetase type III